MGSKWAWLKTKYPSLTDEATYDETLLAAMEPHRGKTLAQLCHEANRIEAEKAEAEQALSGVNAELTAVERLMESAFEAEGQDDLTVGGYTYAVKPEPVPVRRDPVAFKAWVMETQKEILDVNYQTLRGMVSRALESGDDMPPGIEVNVRTSISRRKG